MTTKTSTQSPIRPTASRTRRVAGAVMTSAAIALVGASAVPASAVSAGVVSVGTSPVSTTSAMTVSSASSATALPTSTTSESVRYRINSDGSLTRLG
ncbi:MAG: hypothetical protein LWW86_03975 [Micrococcales bacterium]|nr:hypothetical protein [Micrococcales bacterium]